jgi:hypothetical protein
VIEQPGRVKAFGPHIDRAIDFMIDGSGNSLTIDDPIGLLPVPETPS